MRLFGQSQQIPPTPPPTNTLITNLTTTQTTMKLMTIQPHRRDKRLRRHLIGKTRCPSHVPLPNSPRLALTWNWYTIKTLYRLGSSTHPRTSVFTQCMMKRFLDSLDLKDLTTSDYTTNDQQLRYMGLDMTLKLHLSSLHLRGENPTRLRQIFKHTTSKHKRRTNLHASKKSNHFSMPTRRSRTYIGDEISPERLIDDSLEAYVALW